MYEKFIKTTMGFTIMPPRPLQEPKTFKEFSTWRDNLVQDAINKQMLYGSKIRKVALNRKIQAQFERSFTKKVTDIADFSLEDLNPIFQKPLNSVHTYGKLHNIFLSLTGGDKIILEEKLKTFASDGDMYLVWIKFRYLNSESDGRSLESSFRMAGSQFSFRYDKNEGVVKLLSKIQDNLERSFYEYDIGSQDVEYIQATFKKVIKDYTSELNIDINNKKLRWHEGHSSYTILNIPLSVSHLDVPLDVSYDQNDIVESIEFDSDVNPIKKLYEDSAVLPTGNPNKVNSFDRKWKFYMFKGSILAVKVLDKNTIEKVLINKHGSVLSHVLDHASSDKHARRTIGNYNYFFKKNIFTHYTVDLNIKPLPKDKKIQGILNPNIGAIDTETFEDKDGVKKIYALGFKSNLDDESKTYYISDYQYDAQKLVLKFISDISAPKYSNVIFYCHNLGGYDAFFLLKTLRDQNKEEEKYKTKIYWKDNRVLSMRVRNTLNNHVVTIRDSYSILNRSLNDLASSFGLEMSKSIFPYKFARYNTLSYVGTTPAIYFYNNIKVSEYELLVKDNWDMKYETLKYLELDIKILYEVLERANKQLWKDYKLSIRDRSTISGLALQHFFNVYYKNNIPNINKLSIHDDISKAYYGGITEVYKPYGENLYYYDVNSLYPYVALNPMPSVRNWKKSVFKENDHLGDKFGFFQCDITTPLDQYFGVLPVRDRTGIKFPLGKFSGWYFSEELKLALKLGYEVRLKSGYEFDKEYYVFGSYVENIYTKKSDINTTPVQKSVAKSMLNNLFGRFGISLHKANTKIVDPYQFDKIANLYPITNYVQLDDDNILVTYYPVIDSVLLKELNIDLSKAMKNKPILESAKYNATSNAISAAVNSYGRIHMNELKLKIINELGGNIFYMDTDSIITDIQLPDDMVSPKEIGKLKLENFVKKGIFVSGKLYCLLNEKGKFINRAKGVMVSKLTINDYEKLLRGLPINTIKNSSVKDWINGQVNIGMEAVTLNSNAYNKRIKIYKNYTWNDTRPMIINTIEKAITTYVNRFQLIPHGDLGLHKNLMNKIGYSFILGFLNKYSIIDILKYLGISIFILLLGVISELFRSPGDNSDLGFYPEDIESFDILESVVEDNTMDMPTQIDLKDHHIKTPNLLDLDYYKNENLDNDNHINNDEYLNKITSKDKHLQSEKIAQDAISNNIRATFANNKLQAKYPIVNNSNESTTTLDSNESSTLVDNNTDLSYEELLELEEKQFKRVNELADQLINFRPTIYKTRIIEPSAESDPENNIENYSKEEE